MTYFNVWNWKSSKFLVFTTVSLFYPTNRISNCRFHCSNGTTAFAKGSSPPDSSLGKPIEESSNSTPTVFDMPPIEVTTPNKPPQLCLVDSSTEETCRQFPQASDEFTFNRSLTLASAELLSDGSVESCHFKQRDLSTDRVYDGMLCHTEQHCWVVCDAKELVGITFPWNISILPALIYFFCSHNGVQW